MITFSNDLDVDNFILLTGKNTRKVIETLSTFSMKVYALMNTEALDLGLSAEVYYYRYDMITKCIKEGILEKPSCITRFENSQGAWVFVDPVKMAIHTLYSDHFRSNAYKGSGFEITSLVSPTDRYSNIDTFSKLAMPRLIDMLDGQIPVTKSTDNLTQWIKKNNIQSGLTF